MVFRYFGFGRVATVVDLRVGLSNASCTSTGQYVPHLNLPLTGRGGYRVTADQPPPPRMCPTCCNLGAADDVYCVTCGARLPATAVAATSPDTAILPTAAASPTGPPAAGAADQQTEPARRPRRGWLIAAICSFIVVITAVGAYSFTKRSSEPTAAPIPVTSTSSAPTATEAPSSAPTTTSVPGRATRYFAGAPSADAPQVIVGVAINGDAASGWGAVPGDNWEFCFRGTVADDLLAGKLHEGTGGPVELEPFVWTATGLGADLTMKEIDSPLSTGKPKLTPVTAEQAAKAFAKSGGMDAAKAQQKFDDCRATMRLGDVSAQQRPKT